MRDIRFWWTLLRAMKQLFAFLGLALFGACATPGFDYTASVAPGNPQAAMYRTVAVDRFRGPLGEWYAEQFEGMLQTATFENQPWFNVGLFSRQSNVNGAYYGTVEISRPSVDEHVSYHSVCVERDEETKKCQKKKDIERVCLRYSIAVQATPILVDTQSEEIIHQATYSASDSEQECFDTGHVEYRIRRGPDEQGRGEYRFAYESYNRPGHRLGSDHIIDRITASALRDTVWQARRDIAPYNRETRARVLTKSERPDVDGDPRFSEAVSSVRSGDYLRACTLFTELDADYPGAPSVLHNLGACAEAGGNAADAQGFYAQALSSAQLLGAEPERRVLQALDRISDTRTNEIVINSILPPEG